jgi:hypothetical protein
MKIRHRNHRRQRKFLIDTVNFFILIRQLPKTQAEVSLNGKYRVLWINPPRNMADKVEDYGGKN